jgi:hypothetical protein
MKEFIRRLSEGYDHVKIRHWRRGPRTRAEGATNG